ncbi:MAG: hypothetical protein WDZ35_14080 [Crocinitomicaceae bacterium]
MDQFLDYIEKYKFAILGTALVHIAFFFYANFTTVDQPFKFPNPEVELSVPLDDVTIDPEILKQMELNNNLSSEEIHNLSADAADKREKSYEDYSSQELDEMVESEAKELEQKYFEEWAATHDGEAPPKTGTDIETEDKNEQKNQIDKTTIKTNGSNAFAGEVLVSYYLDKRKAHALPKPGYTCNSSGTVVLDIKVDKAGDVKSASFNASLSSSATECMVNKALEYAKRSRFNFSNSASASQNGTITYKFVGK